MEYMYVFEGIEAMVALELIYVSVVINIELVTSQNRDGIDGIKGKISLLITAQNSYFVAV